MIEYIVNWLQIYNRVVCIFFGDNIFSIQLLTLFILMKYIEVPFGVVKFYLINFKDG